MIIFALFLIPNSIFAENHDSSDMLLSEMSVDEYKSFTENQLTSLAESINQDQAYQVNFALMYVIMGALL